MPRAHLSKKSVSEVSAAGELLCELALVLIERGAIAEITPALASALYAAICSDTGCFKFANVTPRTFEVAAILARERGLKRMSAQAVGGAVGHNPIPLIIPCHRVIGTGGRLVGYAPGLDKKAFLLQLEQSKL